MQRHIYAMAGGAVFAAGLALSISLASAAIGITVAVDLRDATTGGQTGMTVRASAVSVKSGAIVFRAVNRSASLVHEMLVVKLAKPGQMLPYDAKHDKIDEEKVKSLGEVSELEPGKDGTLQVKLAPGVYALLCNQPGHYKAGMAATLTVVR